MRLVERLWEQFGTTYDKYEPDARPEAARRIEALEGCIRRISSMNDHPGWFRKELDEMIDGVGLSHDSVFGAVAKYATDEERFQASPRAMEFSPGWQERAKASAVPEEIAEVVKVLRGWCIDWNGEQMVDGECPRDGLHCNILRRAADLLERLAGLNPHDQKQHQAKDIPADGSDQYQGHDVKSK